MPQPRAARQRELFEDPPADPVVRLPLEVEEQLRQTLVHWMQTLAKAIHDEEDSDEQNYR